MDIRDRFRGCLLGMACGDALGAGIEYMAPGALDAEEGLVTDLVGGGPFNWKSGSHTDDTELSLLLAESLIEHPEVNTEHITRLWLEWLDSGPPNVGEMTRDGLLRARKCLRSNTDPREGGKRAWEATGCDSAGNGSLMRTAPVGMIFARNPKKIIEEADSISQITHYDPRCRASCIVYSLAISQMLTAEKRGFVDLSYLADQVRSLSPVVADSVNAVFDIEAENILYSTFCIDTLKAALWPVDRALSLEEGIVTIVNLGRDSDAVGAIAGALLGARDGASYIPERWINSLEDKVRIIGIADRLYDIAMG
ncbi:MAG: ADP-ribosylglycohydrolase family protein [Planctomycetes bacterium]|nr:ADP-ribosylglycohydrolase family protein [Planctomycetota bacterium]